MNVGSKACLVLIAKTAIDDGTQMEVDFVVGEVEMRLGGEGIVGVERIHRIAHAASGEVEAKGVVFVDSVVHADVSEELSLLVLIVGLVPICQICLFEIAVAQSAADAELSDAVGSDGCAHVEEPVVLLVGLEVADVIVLHALIRLIVEHLAFHVSVEQERRLMVEFVLKSHRCTSGVETLFPVEVVELVVLHLAVVSTKGNVHIEQVVAIESETVCTSCVEYSHVAASDGGESAWRTFYLCVARCSPCRLEHIRASRDGCARIVHVVVLRGGFFYVRQYIDFVGILHYRLVGVFHLHHVVELCMARREVESEKEDDEGWIFHDDMGGFMGVMGRMGLMGLMGRMGM